MYSIPRGSIRKKGPRPNRSFAGTGRSRRTRISVVQEGNISRLIHAAVTWAYRRRALVVGAAFCALAVSAEGARRLSFDTNVLTLLPRDGRVIPAFFSFLSTFGSLDHLYVVFTAPDGSAIADYSDRIDTWTQQLRGAPEIDRVDAGFPIRDSDAWRSAAHALDERRLERALKGFAPTDQRCRCQGARDPHAADRTWRDLVRHDPGIVRIDPRSIRRTSSDSGGWKWIRDT